ncbi:MAG: type III secretion system cytoplasmic ring protein SctQ [Parachlamydiaceae bacterium]|nr:type III secretion system cytoplasmic ring protein SctQ [Parachlamydiaceae bacterium]
MADTFDEEFSSFEDEFSEFDDIESAPPEKPATSKTKETATAVGEDTEDKEDTEVSASTEDDESQDGPKVALGAPAGPLSIADIPMTVVVEVGRVQISVQKLMDLEPGNLLELNIHPENGVDLVVNGVVIAKGELLKIGDSLGVRILDKA